VDKDKNRLNKLDSLLLWVGSLSGVGFSIFVSYLRITWAPYVPIFLLIGFALVIGYLKGAVFADSFTERIRGWNYLLLGLITYSLFISFYILINPFIESFLSGYSTLIQTIVVVTVIAIYIFISVKKIIPWLYGNFDEPYCQITRRIIQRTIVASILLGTTLYVFAILLNQPKLDLSIIVYVITAFLLIIPIIREEKRVGKLLPLEKFYKYVEVEKVEKRNLEIPLLVALGITELLLVIVLWLPIDAMKNIILLLLIVLFFIFFIGYVVSLFLQDKGDLVKETEIAQSELSSDNLAELRQLIIKANT
jgi:hypothetical protein